jgi:hypothetical protein
MKYACLVQVSCPEQDDPRVFQVPVRIQASNESDARARAEETADRKVKRGEVKNFPYDTADLIDCVACEKLD